jgi:hypothetical protein
MSRAKKGKKGMAIMIPKTERKISMTLLAENTFGLSLSG